MKKILFLLPIMAVFTALQIMGEPKKDTPVSDASPRRISGAPAGGGLAKAAIPARNDDAAKTKRAPGAAIAKSLAESKAPTAEYKEGEVLVKFRKGVTAPDARSMATSSRMAVAQEYPVLGLAKGRVYVLLRSSSLTTAQMIELLKKDPRVESVSPNYRKRLDVVPDDTRFNEQWGLNNTGQTGGTPDADIDAPEAWDVTTGSSSVVLADIDTGADYTHPDLNANIWINAGDPVDGIDNDGNGLVDDWIGYDFAADCVGGNDNDPMDEDGHGTHTAGTIGAVGDNTLGVAGVNWNAKVMVVKGFCPDGYMYDSDELECYEYVLWHKQHGVNIVAINASYGGGAYSDVGKDAIEALGKAGIVFCAAAGNSGDNNDVTPHYPSSYDLSTIIAVAATDHNDQLASFSCYGVQSVDLGAPGEGILSTVRGQYIPQAGDIFFDDMESGSANWTHGGTLDTWAITTNLEGFDNPSFPPPSPPNVWSDSPGVDYQPYTDSWLAVASDIDLSGAPGTVYLSFWAALYIEDSFDHGYVEISNDGGANWTELFDFTGYAYYGQQYSFAIPDAFKTANFRFRFHLTSDESVEYWGWLLDNVGVGTTTTYGYEAWDGTSMATPHVTGAVGLLAAEFPGETAEQRVSRILGGVDVVGLTVSTGGRLNISNSMQNGPTETPTQTPSPGPTSTPTETPMSPTKTPGGPTRTPTNTPMPAPTVTPTITPTLLPRGHVELNGSVFRPKSTVVGTFVLDSAVERPFTVFAVVIRPGGMMVNASDLKTALRPLVVSYPGLAMPFSYAFMSVKIPKKWPKGSYEAVVAFFDPSKPITGRGDAFLDASARFGVN